MLNIDAAIKHCEEVAEKNECKMTSDDGCTDVSMKRCAAEHRQLAEWLKELKDLREENKVLTSECDRLIKEKGELNKLKEKAVLDICRREAKLREAKQLLKMAVEDISKMPCNNDTHTPDSCYICVKHGNCSYADSFKWCKADIASKLIGEDENET